MNKKLTFIMFAIVFALGAATLASASAYSYGVASDDPYSYENLATPHIGTYWQAQQTVYYNYETQYHYYDYIAPPRNVGEYGNGLEWIVGLRSPMYQQLPPVYYSNFYAPTCGYNCWFGGYGYPRARASSFPYRTRLGGVFSY